MNTLGLTCTHKRLWALRTAYALSRNAGVSRHWFLSANQPIVWSFDGHLVTIPAFIWTDDCLEPVGDEPCWRTQYCWCANPSDGFTLNVKRNIWVHAGCHKPTYLYVKTAKIVN